MDCMKAHPGFTSTDKADFQGKAKTALDRVDDLEVLVAASFSCSSLTTVNAEGTSEAICGAPKACSFGIGTREGRRPPAPAQSAVVWHSPIDGPSGRRPAALGTVVADVCRRAGTRGHKGNLNKAIGRLS